MKQNHSEDCLLILSLLRYLYKRGISPQEIMQYIESED